LRHAGTTLNKKQNINDVILIFKLNLFIKYKVILQEKDDEDMM